MPAGGAVEARWRTGEAAHQAAAAAEHATWPSVVEEELASSDRIATILRALDELPPRQREIVLLRWREGKSR